MPDYKAWNFDIDRILNPIIPSPPWQHLPYPVSWWFGYRKTKPPPTGNLMPILWAFLGAFIAISIIESVSVRIPSFPEHHAPVIVGSFGAAAVLEFYAIEAPLAQPRNAIGGQLVSALTGVAIAKLFLLSPHFQHIKWLGGALACASATALMALTKTVHPPAGATALLAVVDPNLIQAGWFLIPVMMLGCGLMLAVALLINNLQRRFPVYWWTPEDPRQTKPMFRRRPSLDAIKRRRSHDLSAQSTRAATTTTAGHTTTTTAAAAAAAAAPAASLTSTAQDAGGLSDDREKSDIEAQDSTESPNEEMRHADDIIVRPGHVIVPERLYLTQEELQLLETLSNRL
ncbi:transmembrane protein [Escovopsis weberi]|uniref:Transmembrane protein n=1 Tax=Escovopsis weberi TaxID=150374 RepID=A0A0M8MWW1_ESCWE|nr:transmembrane protein [Escovopsis weberi]